MELNLEKIKKKNSHVSVAEFNTICKGIIQMGDLTFLITSTSVPSVTDGFTAIQSKQENKIT